MVAYTYDRALRAPVKKVPYQASSEEWSELANYTHDIEPMNLSGGMCCMMRDGLKTLPEIPTSSFSAI